jgi:flagellar biosynthesis protein FliQ
VPTELLLHTARDALFLALTVCAPVVLAALLVGLFTGVLQAATQIHDATIGFVPKVAAVVLALSLSGPLLVDRVLAFTRSLLESIATIT